MSDKPQYDGMGDLPEEREMNSDPLGARSDEVSTEVERRGDYPITVAGGPGGRTQVTLEPLDDMADALQEDGQFL